VRSSWPGASGWRCSRRPEERTILHIPEPGLLVSFIVASFVVTIVPGITVSSVVSTALARGLAAGLWMELGVQFGRLSMVAVVAIALELVTGAVSAAFDVIKYAGAAYLVWLGWGYLTRARGLDPTAAPGPSTPWRQVISGFLVLWSNPKALLFFGAFLPQFVDPGYSAWPQVLLLGLIEMGAGLVTDSGYILTAATARHVLGGRGARRLNQAAGIILIGAALWLALQHQA
jgi:threonine/homoserine/homoserine lactone efflux protein